MDALEQSVRRWNEMIAAGEDIEWQRFGRGETNRPAPIATPPFYAIQYFPLSRKSMGGVAVDLSCRVLDRRGQPIPNLYAVGELAGGADARPIKQLKAVAPQTGRIDSARYAQLKVAAERDGDSRIKGNR